MQKTKSLQKKGQCTHCGLIDFISRDHVPPQCLFPKPLPKNLLTVPSCQKCNGGASKDDEYFRLNLSIRNSARITAVRSIAEAALRGLSREKSINFRKAFFSGIEEVDLYARSGIFIERGGTYDVDLTRLNRVVARTVRGLYFHHYKQRLPDWCEVDAWCIDGFSEIGGTTAESIDALVTRVQLSKPVEIGDGVFRYWHCLTDDNAQAKNFCTIWLLVFYDSTTFFGITVGRDPMNI